MNLREKLLQIKTTLVVPKTRYNKFGNYYYRSLEDILEALKPFEKKYKVIVQTKTKTIIQEGIPFVEASALIIDVEDLKAKPIESEDSALIDLQARGQQMPQRSGSASSYAKKYALGNLFGIDDIKDSDSTNTDTKEDSKPVPKAPTISKVKETKKRLPTGDFNKDLITIKKSIDAGKTWEEAFTWLESSEHYDKVTLTKFKTSIDEN
mgnify:CR=1 FL=1|tara:strand:- start:363 stop:986 length:624 start_codon:yes stop_codon:yes gene_type:complete